jgi:cell division protein FtsB
MLRNLAPIVIVLLIVLIGFSAFTGPEGYLRLPQLQARLEEERRHNEDLKTYVDKLKVEVWDLQHDERALEKAVRNQQGLARPNELVYFFDDRSR